MTRERPTNTAGSGGMRGIQGRGTRMPEDTDVLVFGETAAPVLSAAAFPIEPVEALAPRGAAVRGCLPQLAHRAVRIRVEAEAMLEDGTVRAPASAAVGQRSFGVCAG